MRINFKNNKGFTLIELLVVISVISLLSSIVLVSLNGAKAKAKDARRIEDIHSIYLALELYFNDHGAYPAVGRWATSESTVYDSGTGWQTLQADLASYIPRLPNDPVGSGSYGPWYDGNYHYAYGSDGTNL